MNLDPATTTVTTLRERVAWEQALFERIYSYRADPLGYVKYVFPWGVAGTLLADESGPDTWQVDVLNEIRDKYGHGDCDPLRIAIASGHGIGKGALVAWVIHWFMAVHEMPQGVVTAGTKNQLQTKTWRELAKWNNLAVNGHWFKWSAERFALADPSASTTWFTACIPWRKEKPEAFQGTHERYVLIVFDEASAIDDGIWVAASGSVFSAGSLWLALGNPTRGKGAFRECFGRDRNRWVNHQIDARTTKRANKAELDKVVEAYGEDSDYARVRVKGLFPRVDSTQLIDPAIVEAAMARGYDYSVYRYHPLVIGVDVARFGDDQSVITARQGLQVHAVRRYRELDTVQVAARAAEMEDEYRNLAPTSVHLVDTVGVGAGVVDRLATLGRPVIGVNGGDKPALPTKYYNKRAEMWCGMKDWIVAGGALPWDVELLNDLTGPMYGFDAKERVQLERKEDMKARGLASPDSGDSLALTFAVPNIAVHGGPTATLDDVDEGVGMPMSGFGGSGRGITGY